MRLTPLPSGGRAAAARSPDWLWGGLGVTIAGASASFAAYMIVTAPGPGPGSKDFGVFAHFDRRNIQPTATAAVLPQSTPPLDVALAPPPAGGIDPEPTGSIKPDGAPDDRMSTVPRTAATTPLRDFVVRDVFGNKALIEHRQKLSLVRPGSILDGAGKVLAIERRGDSWVVTTAAGVIGGR
jgi:hypothetical protein